MAQNVLAVVAGHQITEEELQAFIGHLPKEQQAYASNPQFKEHCKEQLITFHALAKCGEDEKLDETEEYIKRNGKCKTGYPGTDGIKRNYRECQCI